jgi:hypothetical protein
MMDVGVVFEGAREVFCDTTGFAAWRLDYRAQMKLMIKDPRENYL